MEWLDPAFEEKEPPLFELELLFESSEEGLRAAEPRLLFECVDELLFELTAPRKDDGCTSMDLVEMRSTRLPEERGLGLLFPPPPVVVLTTRSPLLSTEEEEEAAVVCFELFSAVGASNVFDVTEAVEELLISTAASAGGVVEVTLTQLDLKLPFDCILSISEWIISPRGRAMLLMALMALLLLLLLAMEEKEEEDVEVVVGETAEEEVAAAKEPGPSEDCTPWLTTVLYRGCCCCCCAEEEVCEGEVEADLDAAAAAAAAAFAASFFSSFSTSGGIGEMICPISCCFPLLLPFEVEEVGEVVSLMRIAGGLSGLPDLVDLEEEEVVEGVDTFQGSLVGWWW